MRATILQSVSHQSSHLHPQTPSGLAHHLSHLSDEKVKGPRGHSWLRLRGTQSPPTVPDTRSCCSYPDQKLSRTHIQPYLMWTRQGSHSSGPRIESSVLGPHLALLPSTCGTQVPLLTFSEPLFPICKTDPLSHPPMAHSLSFSELC